MEGGPHEEVELNILSFFCVLLYVVKPKGGIKCDECNSLYPFHPPIYPTSSERKKLMLEFIKAFLRKSHLNQDLKYAFLIAK